MYKIDGLFTIFFQKYEKHGLIGLKHFLFFLSYRATRETDRHFLNFRNKSRGRNGAFFKFQYTDKGVMGRGVRFIDFYHYLCRQ